MRGVLIRVELVDQYSLCEEGRSSNNRPVQLMPGVLMRGGTSRPVQLMPGVLIRGELIDQYSLCEEF